MIRAKIIKHLAFALLFIFAKLFSCCGLNTHTVCCHVCFICLSVLHAHIDREEDRLCIESYAAVAQQHEWIYSLL